MWKKKCGKGIVEITFKDSMNPQSRRSNIRIDYAKYRRCGRKIAERSLWKGACRKKIAKRSLRKKACGKKLAERSLQKGACRNSRYDLRKCYIFTSRNLHLILESMVIEDSAGDQRCRKICAERQRWKS